MTTLSEKWRPKTIDEFIGQKEIVKELKRNVFDKSPVDCPNLYFRGMNGVGKTTMIMLILKHVAIDVRSNVLHINCADEGLIGTIRGKVKDAARHGTLSEGEKVIWFHEAYLMSPKAIEALKVQIETYLHVKWFFDSNRNMDLGLDRRCSTYDFLPIEEELIYERLVEIRRKEKLDHIRIDRLVSISTSVLGNLAEAINKLLTPPTRSLVRELFATAVQDYDLAYESYIKSRPNAMDFLQESSVLVATSSKLDFEFKKIIVQQNGLHYHWLMNNVPDVVAMGSVLSIIHEEAMKMKERKEK